MHQAEDGQAAGLTAQLEYQRSGAPVSHGPVVAAGVDEQLAPVAVLDSRLDAVVRVLGKITQAFESGAFVRLDWRLRVSPEKLIASSLELLERVRAAYAVQVADSPAPVDQVEQRLRYHFSQWTMPSSGIRCAGLNSPPVLNPIASSAVCV